MRPYTLNLAPSAPTQHTGGARTEPRGEGRERPENQNPQASAVQTESEGNSLSQGENGLTEHSWGPRDWSGVKPHWAVRSTGHRASDLVTGPVQGARTPRPAPLRSGRAARGLLCPPFRGEREHPGDRLAPSVTPAGRRQGLGAALVPRAGLAPSWHQTRLSQPAWRKRGPPPPRPHPRASRDSHESPASSD